MRFQWYVDLGLRSDRLRLRDHGPEELAFYSTATADIEYAFPFGISELEGIAHRSDYDLGQHMKFSGKDLSYFDEERKERFVPHVSSLLRVPTGRLWHFFARRIPRTRWAARRGRCFKFHPRIAPIKAAVFPLVKRDGMPEIAEKIYRELKRHFNVFYDEKGAIGRRYRRQDEAGTPFCITVDSQTAADGTVTVRDRDSCRQWRVVAAWRRLCDRRSSGRAADSGRELTLTSHEALHQPSDNPEQRLRVGPDGLQPKRLDGGRALVDQARSRIWNRTHSRGQRDVRAKCRQAGRGGCAGRFASLARRNDRAAHWQHYQRRLELLGELGVATLILSPDFARRPRAEDYGRAVTALGEAAELARRFGVRLALEFQSSSTFCCCLETAVALRHAIRGQ